MDTIIACDADVEPRSTQNVISSLYNIIIMLNHLSMCWITWTVLTMSLQPFLPWQLQWCY